MSAYVLDRKHFVAIANFVQKHGNEGGGRKLWVYHPDVQALKGNPAAYFAAHEVANILLIENLESVSYRYNDALEDVPVIRDREIMPGRALKAVEIFGVLRSLQYQSCERNDYHGSLAYAVLIQVLWLAGNIAAKEAGAEAWA